MVAIPVAFYLDRRKRQGTGLSGEPSHLDIQAATQLWYEKGIQDGMERVVAGCNSKLAAREDECRQWIEAARKEWSETEGARLGDRMDEAMSKIETNIADTVARILKPLVAKEIVEEVLVKLVREIEKLLSFEDAIHLKISGPEDLVFELRKHIPPNAMVTVLAGDNPEVTVIANKTVIETRLSEWLARVGVDSNGKERESEPGT